MTYQPPLPVLLLILTACATSTNNTAHEEHETSGTAAVLVSTPDTPGIPPNAENALARLNSSPRHGEWVNIPAGNGDTVRAWVVYPQRSAKAPVVVVVHEIFGLSTWVRATTDQLAADGFIAIAPDLMDGYKLPGAPDSIPRDVGSAAVSALKSADIQRRIDAIANYSKTLPASSGKYGIVGFCWGGMVSFGYAVHSPALGASVVYYGTSPKPEELASVRAPILGLYGSEDARVNATVPPADSVMRALGKTFKIITYPGAGHGFARQQSGMEGANMKAIQSAWPETIAWFRQYLDT